MLSIPRELQVPIHTPNNGIVTTRLNAALFYGGINLVVNTIKQVTGLSVNHVVVIDFNNFIRAVNEIGCVYGTIDRRYFHVNVPGGQQYFQVNLQPGYQDLCGESALQFVTYRHTDTSLERDARDQTFLLEVKQQYGSTLIDNVSKFEHIFGELVQTDPSLHTTDGVQSLINTLISVEGLRVRQVKFKANLGVATSCACVTATPQQIAASVHAFLDGSGIPPAKTSTAALARKLQKRSTAAAQSEQLTPLPDQTIAEAHAIAPGIRFPFELPTVEVNDGYGVPPALRSYQIKAPDGKRYPIYVAVFSTGVIGQYYDVQGTTWTGAPILASPDQTVTVAGRQYYIYYSGQHIQTLAWFANGAAYWVRNTLTLGLSNAQMLSVAERTSPLFGTDAGSVSKDALHQTQAPVSVVASATSTSTRQYVGVIGGFLAVLFVPLAFVLLIRRRGEVRQLRQATGVAEARVAALEGRLIQMRALPPGTPRPARGSRESERTAPSLARRD
jgi:LCP family protein required for cell wall assembly